MGEKLKASFLYTSNGGVISGGNKNVCTVTDAPFLQITEDIGQCIRKETLPFIPVLSNRPINYWYTKIKAILRR